MKRTSGLSFPRKRESSQNFFWIPASAGMTTVFMLVLLCGLAQGAEQTGTALCQKNFSVYKQRINRNPLDDDAWNEFRACTIQLQRWDEAIELAMQIRQRNRDLAAPYLILGLAQMQQRNYERAVEHFDETIRLKPNQPIAYFQMGMAYLFLDEREKALQSAERAVELDPSNPAHHRQLAYTRMLMGDYPLAEASAKKAIELDKEDVAAHKILAKIYAKEGKAAVSAEELSQAQAAEARFAAAHPELVKKPEPAAKPPEEKEEKKKGKEEDFEVISECIGQWNKMREAVVRGDLASALQFFSDYLDTRDQYQQSFNRLGLPKVQQIFSNFSELYDCEVVFASAHCKSIIRSPSGTPVIARIRFERNPDHGWRIRSF
jgi:tetratricopeptide (TPR) repeat protein